MRRHISCAVVLTVLAVSGLVVQATLIGDDVSFRRVFDNVEDQLSTATVGPAVEFTPFTGFFDIDISASGISIVQTSPFGAGTFSIGTIHQQFMEIFDLDPSTGVITGISVTFGGGITGVGVPDFDASFVSFTDDSVVVVVDGQRFEPGSFISIALQTTAPGPLVSSVDKDSFLRAGKKNTNEGGNPRLSIRGSGKHRSLVAFELFGVDVGTVTEATLVLTIAENANNWSSNGRSVDAHPLNVDFAEGNGKNAFLPSSERERGNGPGVTWNCAIDAEVSNQQANCAPKWNGGDFGTATASAAVHTNGLTGDVEWDVTADVLAGSDGWIIKKTNDGQSGHVRYFSKEGSLAAVGDLSLAPRLVLGFD